MVKEVKKRKDSKQNFTKQELALLATFIGLIILVAALGLYAMNIEKIANANQVADLTIPILEEHSEGELSIEVSDMTEGDIKEYILAVSNYKDKDILEKDLTYDVDITPTESTLIKVYKNDAPDNLLTEHDLLIENNKIKANEKTEDIYRIVIEAKLTPKANEKIAIKINS